MDQTGSEKSEQPAEEGAKPSEISAGEHHAGGERSGKEDSPESARRAFDLLERFSGELEEILQSLERSRGSAAQAEEKPPAPERAFRPSSIHFDSSPISTRIDPNRLPPVDSPGAKPRTAPRLLIETLFLILVAAISARTGLRPLLIVAAEAIAFLIVASIELGITRERRRVQRLPAATPSFATPATHEAKTTSTVTAFTLEQIEPLIWRSGGQEAAAEADWPLAAYELPSEAEETEDAQEGVTEISSAQQPEAEVVAAPDWEPEEDLDSPASAQAVEPEPEVIAAEVAPEQPRYFHLFRHEEKVLEAEPETAPVAELESLPDLAAKEAEPEPEVIAAEVAPEQPRHFHLFRHEEKVLEAEPEVEQEPEIAPAEAAFEIDLPPEIAVEEIGRTLEDIERPEPGLRGRRWSHRADAEKPISVRAPEDDTVDAGREVRLTAEQERRRREREYLRNLRVSR